MALPYTLEAGTLARASEVQANFDHIMDIIGEDSSSGEIAPSGDIIIGARRNMQISGAHDVSASDLEDNHLHVGYNAQYKKSGTTGNNWYYTRFRDGEAASAFQIGPSAVTILTTSSRTGDLNSQLQPVFSVEATTGADFVYINPSFHLTNVNSAPTSIEQHRLTFTPLLEPATVLGGGAFDAQTVVYNATSYGIPAQAKGIQVQAFITASASSGATLRIRQERAARDQKYGLIVYAPMDARGASEGFVYLGTGSYEDKFAVTSSAYLTECNLWIKGYYL